MTKLRAKRALVLLVLCTFGLVQGCDIAAILALISGILGAASQAVKTLSPGSGSSSTGSGRAVQAAPVQQPLQLLNQPTGPYAPGYRMATPGLAYSATPTNQTVPYTLGR